MSDKISGNKSAGLVKGFALTAMVGIIGILAYDREYGESEVEGLRINNIVDRQDGGEGKIIHTNSIIKLSASLNQAALLSVGDCIDANVRGLLMASAGGWTVGLNSAQKVDPVKCER